MEYLPSIESITTPYGSLRFPTAQDRAALRAFNMLPAMLRGVEETETLRPARLDPTMVFRSPSLSEGTPPPEAPRFPPPPGTKPGPTREDLLARAEQEAAGGVRGGGLEETTPALLGRLRGPVPDENAELRGYEMMGPPTTEMVETRPAETRTTRRSPTQAEVLERMGAATDPRTAAALMQLLPSYQQFMAQRLTPQQREAEREAAANEEIRQLRQRGELKTDTDEEWAAAIKQAEQRGAYDQAQALTRQWRPRQMVQKELARGAFRQTTLPKIREQLQVFEGHDHYTPEDRAALESAIAAAEDDPTPRTQSALTAAVQAMPRMLAQRQRSAQYADLAERRFGSAQQRANEAVKAGNLRGAEQNVRFMLSTMNAEIYRLKRERDNALSQREGARIQAQIDELEHRKARVQDWFDEVTGSRAVTPGGEADMPRPDIAIPPTPGSARKPAPSGAREQFQDLLR